MPAARGVKRSASKTSTTKVSSGPKNKKKRGPIQLDIPNASKKRGRVVACGQGDVGQLGLGEDVMETSRFKYISALGDKIVSVCAGGMHTVALDSNGKVWTFGCNDEGALGRPTAEDGQEGKPSPVALPRAAVLLTAGDSHSAALLDNGHVYAWGAFRDSHGSMGLVVRGREGKPCKEPVWVDIGETAVDIASGGDHLVILSVSGTVYTMGCGEQGQLGRLAQRSASREARQGFNALLVPSKVTLKGGASRVWAGYHATFALDANNEKMFAWGLNNYGQLGITGEKRKIAIYSPTECDAFNTNEAGWRSVSCGQHHTLALDRNGLIYAIGRCEYGRLGLGDRTGDAEVLEPIPTLQKQKCVSISAGTSNSFAVTDVGSIYSWGMGSEGQLGTGGSSDAGSPTPAPLPLNMAECPALAVAAGGQHTLVLVEDPSSQKEPSPAPEQEIEAQKSENVEEDQRPIKRQKTEQEDEISSTSSAQANDVQEESKPLKLNGDENKDENMDVDESDKKEDLEESKPEEKKEPEEIVESKVEEKLETDTSSQDTTDDETKSQESESKDVEMTDNINGNPETVEKKTVETSLPTATTLTTTA